MVQIHLITYPYVDTQPALRVVITRWRSTTTSFHWFWRWYNAHNWYTNIPYASIFLPYRANISVNTSLFIEKMQAIERLGRGHIMRQGLQTGIDNSVIREHFVCQHYMIYISEIKRTKLKSISFIMIFYQILISPEKNIAMRLNASVIHRPIKAEMIIHL